MMVRAMTPADDFTPAGYRTLLDNLRERGYSAVDYPDVVADARHVVLRHDVDMSLDAAVALGAIEAALGMASTYFILLRSPLYNAWAEQDRIGALIDQGHRIGLHLDASLYAPDALDAAAAAEAGVLETIVGRPVAMISFHRPAKALLRQDRPLAGRPHAYQPRWFNAIGYCSDSRGLWAYGHPLEHKAVAEGRAIQLLTHPIWWRDDRRESVQLRLDRLAAERHDAFRHVLDANCEPFDHSRASCIMTPAANLEQHTP